MFPYIRAFLPAYRADSSFSHERGCLCKAYQLCSHELFLLYAVSLDYDQQRLMIIIIIIIADIIGGASAFMAAPFPREPTSCRKHLVRDNV